MGTRVLRIELRRSVALPAGLLIVAVGAFVLFASNPPYLSWIELTVVQRDVMQLTWPLALAAGAWQGIRERRSRVEELVGTTPRPRWWRVLPVAGAMAIAMVGAYLVMLAVSAAHLRYPAAYFPAGAVTVIALGVLAMVAAVWLGQAIGALLPSPLTPPLLAVVGFLGLALLLPGVIRNPVGSDPGTVLLLPYLQLPHDRAAELQMLSGRAALGQGLWLAALAATGLALFAAARRGGRVLALAPAVLGAAIVVPMLPRQVAAAWVEDHRAAEVICTRDAPRVCSSRVYSYLFGVVREPAGRALSTMAGKLPSAPTRVLLDDPSKSQNRSADTVVIELGVFYDTRLPTSDDLLWTMLQGAGVPPCDLVETKGDQAQARYIAARSAVADWLLDIDPPVTSGTGDKDAAVELQRRALAVLRALPTEEQRARVATLRNAELTCVEGDRYEMLVGSAR